ncbi:MAG: hypothetical protein K2G31_04170, partial [Clostridia bacterium]|nr:hypothetical protein [Clostridia bacterium]
MRRTIRRVCTVLCCVALVMLVAMLAVACNNNDNKNQVPEGNVEITLVEGVGGGVTQSTVSARAGALLKDIVRGVTPKDVESLTFGGWFIDGEPLSDEATVPEDGCTLTAKYKAAYTVSVYEQNIDGAYVKKADEQGSAWFGEKFTYSNVPEHFSIGNKPNGAEFVDSKTSSESLGINEKFVVYLARNKYTVNVVCGADGEADYQVERFYGASVTLKTERELGLGIKYRLKGWANENESVIAYKGGDSVTVSKNMTINAVWDAVFVDLFGGDDYIFISLENHEIYLRREGLGEKCGTLNDSGLFSFEDDGGVVLDGRVVGEMFYYHMDVLENTYTAFDGSAATIQLKAHGAAEYTPDKGTPIQGTYEIDPYTGDFRFATDGSEQTLVFSLTTKNDAVVFRTVDSEEVGYYQSYTTDENSNDYDMIYLDGIGKLKYYFVSEDAEDSFDIFDGTYVCVDEKTKTYSITLVSDYGYEIMSAHIRLEVKKASDDSKFRGVYFDGDDYRGDYEVGDWLAPTKYTLDGFGVAYKNGEQGTYTVGELEHWFAMDGSNVYEVTEHYIQVTVGTKTTMLYFVDDLSGQVAVEVEGAFGRYDFKNILFVNGAIYNDGEKNKAFITLTRTSGGAIYAMVWIGMLDDESGEWIYQILVEDTAFKSGNKYTFNGTELKFDFTVDESEHTALYSSDSIVFADDEDGKLEIDLSGKAWFTAVGGAPTEVEYTVEE